MYANFGAFVKAKRQEKSITLRQLANMLDVSAPYVTDVEKDRRNPFNNETLEKLSSILELSKEEEAEMYELAGDKRNEVAPDLPDYIMERGYVSAALRTAKELDADEADWQRFVDELKKRKG